MSSIPPPSHLHQNEFLPGIGGETTFIVKFANHVPNYQEIVQNSWMVPAQALAQVPLQAQSNETIIQNIRSFPDVSMEVLKFGSLQQANEWKLKYDDIVESFEPGS